MRTVAKKRLWFLVSALVAPFSLAAAGALSFEPNLGQTGSDIRYVARASSGVIFITDRGVVLRGTGQSVPAFELAGADFHATWQPEAATAQTISYYVGRDPSKWLENIARYQRLVRRNVYPGIDLILYGSNGQLEYDFQLAPHADPSRILLRLTDARHVSIAEDGSLVVDTSAGEFRHRAPVLAEMLPDGSRRKIAGSFRLTGPNEFGFRVESHDPDLPLSIDPVLESSTYFGGHGDDQVIATDGRGSLVGNTTSIDLPNATFARRAGTSVFIQVQSQIAVFGCTGNMTATAAVLSNFSDPTSAVVGYADCPDLPTTAITRGGYPLSLQPNYSGGASDGFLLMFFPQVAPTPLAADSISLSYIGGPGDDRVNAVAVSGTVAIAGSTTAGGLPEPSFTSHTGTLAGGLDAFAMLVYPNNALTTPQLEATTYLGGSGDDSALGIAVSKYIYITGETKSSNFPLLKPLYSKRQGDSDAFVAALNFDGTLAMSSLFGGSGSDNGAAIGVLPSGNVVVAGVTSSADFPTRNPTQKAYGGGASDAFLAQFTPALDALVSSTFIGGSEADAATSVATGFPNSVYVGGWTTSQNFPVVNALQPKYGGGPDDGFLVHFDDDGSIYEATYFGGSGSDQILGVTTGAYLAAPTVWLTGTTSSPNLPLKNPSQSTLIGNSDGFAAEITANLITISSPIAGGKDLRVEASFGFGNSQLGATTTFKITSSDPSKVPVAADATSPGTASIELQPNGPNFGNFYLDCLTDSGGATLTISAPVYGSKSVPVTCYPETIEVAWYNPTQYNQSPGEAQTNVGNVFTIVFELIPAAPAQAGALFNSFTRPGAPPVIVDISSSNPDAGTVSPTSVPLSANNQNTAFTAQFTALAPGKTELTFDAGGIPFTPSNTLPVNVGGTFYPIAPFAVPTGYQAAISMSQAARGGGTPFVTVTSKDPSRIALSLDGTKKGTGSITIPPSGYRPFFVQAVGSGGSTELVFSVAGEPDMTTAVSITTPTVRLSFSQSPTQPIQLAPGGYSIIVATVTGADPTASGTFSRNPGAPPITFTAHSSHSGVVAITPASAQIIAGTGTYPSVEFSVNAIGVGSTVVSVTNSANLPIVGPFHSATFNVKTPATGGISFPDVEIGKNLIAPMTLALPAPAKSDVVITASVSDPTLALFSIADSAGLPQITTFIPGGQRSTQLFVHGLADSGTVKVTANVAGYSPVAANVNLDRSGFFWSQDTFTTSIGTTSGLGPQILVGPLDAASGLPVGSQSLDASAGGALTISSSNANVVSVPSQFPVSSTGTSPQIGIQSAGTATLSLSSLPGFTTPSTRQKLTVDVSAAPPPYLTGANLGKYLQTPISFGGYSGNPPLTITSSDPSKVLLTTDVTKRGSGKIIVQGGQQVFAQALSSSGRVTITITASGYPKVAAAFTLIPVGFGIVIGTDQFGQSGATLQNGIYTTTTQSIALNVQVGLYVSANTFAGAQLMPGIAPLKVSVTSSNTGAAVITGSPITIPANAQSYQLGTATLLQVSPGETTISISQPPGFTSVGTDRLTVQVTAPTLTANNATVAKDTLTNAQVVLGQGLKPLSVDLPVTVASSDPKRILLSPDATTAPTASITVTIPAASAAAAVFLHALSDNGTVPLQITASGFTANPWTIQLCPLAFALTSSNSLNGQPVMAAIQQGPQTATVQVGPLTNFGFNPNNFSLTLRPGVPPIKVGVTSSNPAVVSVAPSVTFSGTVSNAPLTFTPLKPGNATLSLKAPSGYAIAPTQGQLLVEAQQAAVNISTGGGYSAIPFPIGKDLQSQISVTVPLAPPNATMTITSSDPSRLLVATDNMTPGHASITVPVTGQVFVQALAGSGSAKLTATSPGYSPATLQVNFTPSGVIFAQGTIEQLVFTNAGVVQQTINLVALDPGTLRPGNTPQSPRPGANLAAIVTSSDPKVMAVTTPSVPIPIPQFGNSSPVIGVQPVSQGTAIVTISLAGNPPPEYDNQILFDVTEPALTIPAITIGQDLQAPAQISLGSAIATPAADLKISVYGGTNSLSNDPAAVGQGSIQVIIPAGKRISNPFYVQGMFPGTSALKYSVLGSSESYSTPVVVTQTAFVIQEAANGPLNLSAGTTSNLTVVPTLSPPLSGAPAVSWTVRPGAPPITISIASSNTAVATTSPAQITFKPGDQKQAFTVQGLAPGTTTIQLLGFNYDFSQPQSSIAVTVK